MKTTRLLTLLVMFATFGTTLSASAQYGWQGYSSNVAPTIQTQNQATPNSARSRTNSTGTNSTGVQKNDPTKKATIPQTRLLAFGVNDYPLESGLDKLGGCVNDANAVGETFDYAESTVLTDEKATRDAILQEMQKAAGKRYGRLIFFFAGHGINVQGHSFVCPFDARVTEETKEKLNAIKDKNKVVAEGKKYGLIPLIDILNVLKRASATEVLVVLDACRDPITEDDARGKNGDFMRELIDLGKKNGSFTRPNQGAFAVLTSCSEGQLAGEYPMNGQKFGIFAHFWLEGIRTGKADYAGLGDGLVTLVEAYNYAYSKTTKYTQGRQAPERYMSNVSNYFILKKQDDPSKVENETDLQFLSRTGRILANLKWSKEDNLAGREALDCVLNNVPNDVLSRASRASLRRKLGDYEGALDDCAKIGEKFQLYAVRDPKAPNDATPAQGKGINEIAVHEYDLLTITKIEGGRYYVSEVNNDPSKKGWIDKERASWSLDVNGMNVATATPTQNARTTLGAGGMIAPGNSAVTGPRPFVGTLGF